MCDPSTITMIGTATKAYSGIQQGNQGKAFYDYHAERQMQDAQSIRDTAKSQAAKIRKAGNSQVSQATAALAASGVEVGTGTAGDITKDIIRDSEMDAQTALLTGARQSVSIENQAEAYRMAGKNAKKEGYYKAAGSLIGNASGIKDGWLSAQQSHNEYKMTKRLKSGGSWNPEN